MDLSQIGLQDFYIDLNSEVVSSIQVKEGELNSRGLLIHIVDRGQPVDMRSSTVTLYTKNENGKLHEKKATVVDAPKGIYQLVFPANMLIQGEVEAELAVRQNDFLILSRTFRIDVDGRVVSGLVDGFNDPDIIEQLLMVNLKEEERIALYETIKAEHESGELVGPQGEPGEDGKSAYQIWLDEGNVGTEQDFLDSLKGPEGPPGKDGADGPQGPQGPPGEGSGGGLDINGKIYSASADYGEVIVNIDEYIDGEPVEMEDFDHLYVMIDNDVNSDDEWMPLLIRTYYGYNDPLEINGLEKIWTMPISSLKSGLHKLVKYELPYGGFVFLLENSELIKKVDSFDLDVEDLKESRNVSSYIKAVTRRHSNGKLEIDFDEYANELYGDYDKSYSKLKDGSRIMVYHNSYHDDNGEPMTFSIRNGNQRVEGEIRREDDDEAVRSMGFGYYEFVLRLDEEYPEHNELQMISSPESRIGGINASRNSISTDGSAQVNSSYNVLNDTNYSSAWGYYPHHTDPSTQNIKIHLLSESGDINHSGVLNSGHNFTDFAELFPNLTGEAQGYGLIQTIDGHGVRPANSGDQVVGVTSATAGVVLGETPFSWADRWLRDEWGAFIYHDILDENWEPNEDKGETEEDRPTITIPKENPEYDPNMEQVTRQERPDEWSVVGLVGQVYVRLDENVEPMDYVKPLKDGIGQTSSEPTSIRVMKITQEFDKDKGYKIGFCLLK